MRRIGSTELSVFPLCLGGNVFGWTANEAESFAVLDAFAAAGGNFIDTADAYSAWVPGNSGGESETILGRWMASRNNRKRMVIATKVGMAPGLQGLRADTIARAIDASLTRLQVETIDLYYAHRDDPETPQEETLVAFDRLVTAGKVRHIAASNFTAARLEAALDVSRKGGLTRYVALQPHYNLVHRRDYEGPLAELCALEGISCFPYFSLARGFLTGKYRPGADVESARAEGAKRYLDERGLRVLSVLDELSKQHRTTVAAIALAWLLAQPTVTAPIASARTRAQLDELLPSVRVELSKTELDALQSASA